MTTEERAREFARDRPLMPNGYTYFDFSVWLMAQFARTETASLRAVLGELADVLESFTDDDECRFDHHGYCQTHFGGTYEGKCRNVYAKELLEKAQAVAEGAKTEMEQ